MAKTVEDLAERWLTRRPDSLSELEQKVLQSAIDRHAVTQNVNDHLDKSESKGQRLADVIARVGGSWSFIITFLLFLLIWTVGNVYLLAGDAFDPYPFIFLNLILSMLAALQAPVIMMSQNRQAERDRVDASHDYAVNLKSEIEIMALHEKFDELRRQEIIAMREEFARIAAQLDRIEKQGGKTSA